MEMYQTVKEKITPGPPVKGGEALYPFYQVDQVGVRGKI